LGKIGASQINSLSPAISPLEILISTKYAQWRSRELAKRRWVFATELVTLTSQPTPVVDPTEGGRTYKFNLPGNFIRPIRNSKTTWQQRGQFLYDYASTTTFEYIRDVPDNEIADPLFIEVLACAIAVECAEPATQSPGKKREAVLLYKDALQTAAQGNAFTLDVTEHPVNSGDEHFSWVVARENPYG
jgi:hypothetical protein